MTYDLSHNHLNDSVIEKNLLFVHFPNLTSIVKLISFSVIREHYADPTLLCFGRVLTRHFFNVFGFFCPFSDSSYISCIVEALLHILNASSSDRSREDDVFSSSESYILRKPTPVSRYINWLNNQIFSTMYVNFRPNQKFYPHHRKMVFRVQFCVVWISFRMKIILRRPRSLFFFHPFKAYRCVIRFCGTTFFYLSSVFFSYATYWNRRGGAHKCILPTASRFWREFFDPEVQNIYFNINFYT